MTISLPRDLLRRVKVVAAKRDTSISALLAESVEAVVRDDEREVARRRFVQRLRAGVDLGTGGTVPAWRDELHAR